VFAKNSRAPQPQAMTDSHITSGAQHMQAPLRPVSDPEVAEVGRLKLFSFFEELGEPLVNLLHAAWRARGKLVRDVRLYTVMTAGAICSMPGRTVIVLTNPKLHAMLAEEEDPEAFASVIAGAGGAICIGSAGAVIGTAMGSAAGTAAGVVPAVFTFGLSLPIGAVIGGASGLAVGATVGSGAGLIGGSTTGYIIAASRHDIRRGVRWTHFKFVQVYTCTVSRPISKVKAAARSVQDGVQKSVNGAACQVCVLGDSVKNSATDPRIQITVASGVVGGASLGAVGAAGGAVAGGTVGALVGLIPAIFTFGLSIPVGAAIGGGAGLCAGGAAGTAVGFMGASAAGFTGYTYRGLPGKVIRKTGMRVFKTGEGIPLQIDSRGGTEENSISE